MAILKRNRNLKTEDNTGFGNNSTSTGGRFVNKDGHANVIKRGINFFGRNSSYHTLLEMNNGKFILLLIAVYVAVNLFFAGIYYLIGIEHLNGVNTGSPLKNFTEVFFFSAQTFTTVGYGRISPVGFAASAVSTFEAFVGLLSFALATGLFYGRFSRPQAFIRFSKIALIAPFNNGTALMFRLVPYKNNNLSEAEAKVTVAITEEENGTLRDKFYNLDLQITKVNTLPLSWTIVHPIDENSPFYGLTKDDIAKTDIEIMVFIKAFDDGFSNNVVARTSFVSSEIVWGAKFKPMYHPSEDKMTTVLDINKLNDFDFVPLPEPSKETAS